MLGPRPPRTRNPEDLIICLRCIIGCLLVGCLDFSLLVFVYGISNVLARSFTYWKGPEDSKVFTVSNNNIMSKKKKKDPRFWFFKAQDKEDSGNDGS